MPINSGATRRTGGARSSLPPSSTWKTRLTDAVLDMADKLIGGLFAKARNATRQRYVASAANVGRLMRLFHGTIEALAAAQEAKSDAFEAVDEAVGWPKLLRVRDEVRELANLADEDPLVRAADRWRTLHKFAPALIEALEFRSGARQRSDAGRPEAAGRPQPIGQARDTAGCADAVPQGVATAGIAGRATKPASLRNGGPGHAARQAAIG